MARTEAAAVKRRGAADRHAAGSDADAALVPMERIGDAYQRWVGCQGVALHAWCSILWAGAHRGRVPALGCQGVALKGCHVAFRGQRRQVL